MIASKNIVCYKRLREYDDDSKRIVIASSILRKFNGKRFSCVINNVMCEGKISVDAINNKVYFCTNNADADGHKCTKKFGYEFSWKLDNSVELSTLIVAGIRFKHSRKKVYFTPYRNFTVFVGQTYSSRLKKYGSTIEDGLHSFVNVRDAKYDGTGVVVKCVIPKGSQYYVGAFYGCSAYASSALKYVCVVK